MTSALHETKTIPGQESDGHGSSGSMLDWLFLACVCLPTPDALSVLSLVKAASAALRLLALLMLHLAPALLPLMILNCLGMRSAAAHPTVALQPQRC